MYKSFYGLTRNPFEGGPDPYFFFSTARHTEALALLSYGVLQHKGFAVVTGEVGTGKTLVVRCLLDSLEFHKVAFAYIFNPILKVQNFLEQILSDLGLPAASHSKSEVLARLNNHLLARSSNGLTTALVVDEAQLLSWDLLEEIRLLTNLETASHKLLQIVLAGQPELDRKLDSHQLRQLKQRVGVRCNLLPLSFSEVEDYICRRLELAGANGREKVIFSKDAVAEIVRISKGIPRLVNTLCDNALMIGFGLQVSQITPAIIEEVSTDFRLEAASVSSKESSTESQSSGPPSAEEGPTTGLKLVNRAKSEDQTLSEALQRLRLGTR